MGREWYSSTRSLATTGDCGRESSGSPGCMGGVFHHLHFHHLLFTGNISCCRAPSASSPSSSSSSSLPSTIGRTITPTSQQHRGLEAPRNSLELDEAKASSTASVMEEAFKDVPVAIEIVPTPASLSRSSSKKKIALVEGDEKRSSQAETPRTPSLVARLMGLDILADQSPSPTPKTPPLVDQRVQIKKMNAVGDRRRSEPPPPPQRHRQPLQSLNCNILSAVAAPRARIVDGGSRSLPDSPRVSTTARTSDIDRRLSLQVHKENVYYFCEVTGDYSLPPSPSSCSSTKSKKKVSERYVNDENKSPIVKQVKESITITKRDEFKSKSKRTRPPPEKRQVTENSAPQSSTLSPRVRILEVANSNDEGDVKKPLMMPSKPSNFGGVSDADRGNGEAKVVKVVLNKCRKADHERFMGRIKNQTPHSPGSSRSLPTLALLFQSADGSQENNYPDKNNSSLSTNLASSRAKQASPAASQPTHSPCGGGLQVSTAKRNRRRRELKDKDPEFRYIRSIFEHARIAGACTLRWYSRSLPIDPVIFHRLELEFPFFLMGEGDRRKCSGEVEDESRSLLGHLRHRWNRKLLFHLVQEILSDLLIPSSNLSCSSSATSSATSTSDASAASINLVRRENSNLGNAEALLQQLAARIVSFPDANCRVVGDIDALVVGDMPEANVRRLLSHASVLEQARDVVSEVEQEILDGLLRETAASLAFSSCHRGGGGCGAIGTQHSTVLTETAGAH
ncbi:hypothetical protein Cni_G18396 [Canna indica]|uniref:DUF4378 domain-containing protein n=1 Tax=Canna indica TaxID=4628 RepID=A0AAQ3QHM7_9LILI|nr:hypothetical protein Cni_G18396 [Canna indica]